MSIGLRRIRYAGAIAATGAIAAIGVGVTVIGAGAAAIGAGAAVTGADGTAVTGGGASGRLTGGDVVPVELKLSTGCGNQNA